MPPETAGAHTVRIHIDQHPFQSPTPTTGEALYDLGHIHADFELFQEVTGDEEDKLIRRDSNPVHLQEDEHFHSARDRQHGVQIILDGNSVVSPERRRNGRQIRELGPADRVDGFETQEVNAQGKKKRTIRDTEEIELHHDERFRTVPSEGGPGERV